MTFDLVFYSDDEMNNAFEDLMNKIGPQIAYEESKEHVPNELRLKQMEFCVASLAYLTKDEDVEISYAVCEPFPSMGSIHLEFGEITFEDMLRFSRVCEFADNMEIYPLTNGKLRMSFAFHGVATPAE